MTEEHNTKKIKPIYSEMLIRLVQEFDEKLPSELTIEETFEMGIDAWNLANNKAFLESRDLYEKELKGHKNHQIIDEMVNYKIDHFSDFNNIILDYTVTDNKIQVKSQTQKNHFDNVLGRMINYNPNK